MDASQQSIRTAKAELRRRMLHERSQLTAEQVAERSAAIRARLESIEAFRAARTVLTYVAALDNEVDTTPFLEAEENGGRRVLIPVMAPQRALRWSEVHSRGELTPNTYGVPEPRLEFLRFTPPPADAVALVPGLAFTPEGDRVGFGGGYYDRFLAGHPGLKIGLAFDLQLLPSCPSEPHDVPMDLVVTESRVYRRG